MPRRPPAVRARDREATEALLIEALERVLSRDGFRGLGVNAVAREAGVDKVLIYRYFGGLDGLVAAFGERLDVWLGSASQVMTAEGAYGERILALLRAYLATLKQNRGLRQMLAWELVESSPLLRKLEATRSRAVGRWMARARGDATPPPEADAPAINALLLAAMHYLLLRQDATGSFAGLDLTAPATWQRLDRAIECVLTAAYSPASRARGS